MSVGRLFFAVLTTVWLSTGVARAYTAAGDRLFPATVLLPQIAPTDELYVTGATVPAEGTRSSSISTNYNKTITERFGIGLAEGYNWLQRNGAQTRTGWQDTDVVLQYLAVQNAARELLVSIGIDRQFGGTGSSRAGANRTGATTGWLYLGKGLGDLDAGLLKPVSVAAVFGYQLGDSSARKDTVETGVAVEYSIPYLESNVTALALPDFLKSVTPMVEAFLSTPEQAGGGGTALTVAPGFDYAGAGWELGLEALIPATRATGQGLGATLQFHFALDYLFPGRLGRPLFQRNAM